MDRTECPICGPGEDWDVFNPFCRACGGPLLFQRTERRRAFRKEARLPLERYADYLPLPSIDPGLSLFEGNTPLLRLGRVSQALGLTVLAKNETQNPTWSFKDRGTSVAVQKAVAMGIRAIGTVSTGNMAASTAAYGARAGLRTVILVKEDTGPEKIISTAVHGPTLLAVHGDYGGLFRKSYDLGRKFGIYFANSTDPLRLEGYKLTAFEVYEQLGNKPPDALVLPVSSGGHFIGLMRGFIELKADGLISDLPFMAGVQAEGCSPLARAVDEKKRTFTRFPHPSTIAQAISNPDPPGGNAVLSYIRTYGGTVLAVSDGEMLEAQKRLSEHEGLFCLPDSAAALAGLMKLRETSSLKSGETAVLVLTGSGLKNLHLAGQAPPAVVRADLDNLDDTLTSLA
ncbi:MAG: threonine synthase [Candidatus Aminicenantes bacterium RBG_13_63_10]|nr:MAG: threonine synthase [Candidatus Aminicenantes bacterium RBG_13_63_10]